MSGMKKYFTIAKQVAKEKIGKVENVNSDEVDSEREHFTLLKDGYTKIHTSGKALHNEHWSSFMSHNEVFINNMLAFSTALKESSLTSTSTKSLSDALQYVGDGLQRENKIAGYCAQSIKSGFVETVHKICDVYLKDVSELRSQQEMARLQLSHAIGQLKGMQKKASAISSKDAVPMASKLQQAEDDNTRAQEEYNNATSSFIEGMERLETAGRKEFVSSLTSLVEAHLRSMEEGISMWKDVLANLEKLEADDTSASTLAPTAQAITTPQTQIPTLTVTQPTLPTSYSPNPTLTMDSMFEPAHNDGITPIIEPFRKNSSPKPYIPEITVSTTPPVHNTSTLSIVSNSSNETELVIGNGSHLDNNTDTSITPQPSPLNNANNHSNNQVTGNTSKELPEEYEELAL